MKAVRPIIVSDGVPYLHTSIRRFIHSIWFHVCQKHQRLSDLKTRRKHVTPRPPTGFKITFQIVHFIKISYSVVESLKSRINRKRA